MSDLFAFEPSFYFTSLYLTYFVLDKSVFDFWLLDFLVFNCAGFSYSGETCSGLHKIGLSKTGFSRSGFSCLGKGGFGCSKMVYSIVVSCPLELRIRSRMIYPCSSNSLIVAQMLSTPSLHIRASPFCGVVPIFRQGQHER